MGLADITRVLGAVFGHVYSTSDVSGSFYDLFQGLFMVSSTYTNKLDNSLAKLGQKCMHVKAV